MSALRFSSVTILIHTANRQPFVQRLLRYYDSVETLRTSCLVVADGSSADHPQALSAGSLKSAVPHEILQAPTVPFTRRLQLAMARITTPYVLVAADDDFYFFDWLHGAVERLDRHPDCEAVVGDYLLFTLGAFRAYSDHVSVSEPAGGVLRIPFLEAEAPEERLAEHVRNSAGLITIGWYALQRTATLRAIIDYGLEFELPLLLYERFTVVAQTATGKVHMSQDIFIARQTDAAPGRAAAIAPLGYHGNEAAIQRLLDCTRTFCCERLGWDRQRADAFAALAYANEIAMMRQADRRRWLRDTLNSAPSLRRIVDRVRSRGLKPQIRDKRLPSNRDPAEVVKKRQLVTWACRYPEGQSA